MTAECVVAETRKDKTLKQVMQNVRHEWNNNPSSVLLPYFQRRHELTIENDMLLWGDRMIIPELLREILLKDLHGEHLGIVRSKQLARIYLRWPKLDNDLENMVKACQRCQEYSKKPKGKQTRNMVMANRALEKTTHRLCRTRQSRFNVPSNCGRLFKIFGNFSSEESRHKNNHRKS